jgi:hypothetical protein
MAAATAASATQPSTPLTAVIAATSATPKGTCGDKPRMRAAASDACCEGAIGTAPQAAPTPLARATSMCWRTLARRWSIWVSVSMATVMLIKSITPSSAPLASTVCASARVCTPAAQRAEKSAACQGSIQAAPGCASMGVCHPAAHSASPTAAPAASTRADAGQRGAQRRAATPTPRAAAITTAKAAALCPCSHSRQRP